MPLPRPCYHGAAGSWQLAAGPLRHCGRCSPLHGTPCRHGTARHCTAVQPLPRCCSGLSQLHYGCPTENVGHLLVWTVVGFSSSSLFAFVTDIAARLRRIPSRAEEVLAEEGPETPGSYKPRGNSN